MNRSRYQGISEIFGYNRPFYLGTVAICVLVMAASMLVSGWLRWMLLAGATAALFWTAASLAASHWIYDRSTLYSLSWLHLRPRSWLNIHAGLDQTTELLAEKLGTERYAVYDIFDPAIMTEPSIQRARELSHSGRSLAVSWRSLPDRAGVWDAVFLIFAAHELRTSESRTLFLAEVRRVLSSQGRLLMVEHFRDTTNFLAFGPGSLHFHSRATWMRDLSAAGFALDAEKTITPFVHVLELKPT